MNNSKSIFSRYFAICSAVILISFCCLGTVLLLVSSRYFLDEKKSLMLKNAKALALYTQDKMMDSPDSWLGQVRNEIKDYTVSSNADYLLCSEDGYVVVSLNGIRQLEPMLLQSFTEDGAYIYSSFGDVFDETSHVMGVKFSANGPVYYMLAYSSKSAQDNYTHNIMQIFLISAIIVLLAAMFLVYFATVKLTAPIKEIADISKRIGKGDFSVTLPEYSTSEFRQLSSAFNEMAANLKSYDTMRNSFLANVSHELRTPMTSIGGFVDGLLDGTIPKKEEKKYLRIISSEVERLTRLVKSMLNLAKIEAGELQPNKTVFSVTEPIVNTLVTFESKLEEKQLDVRGLDVDRITMYADLDLIHQVMYNLIENAIKFADKGGYIQFAFDRVDEFTSVSIRNSGEGLEEDELPLVFDRFYKTDKSRGIDAKGLGLGLNIARSIVEIHGGIIMVTSIKGEYTEFTFTIPNPAEDEDQ